QAEDGIRDRNVTGVQTCALPIFIAFVVAADEYDVVFPTQGFSHSLIERPTLRTHQYDAWIAEVKSIHGIEDGLGLQDHACPATVRIVIHRVVLALGIVPEVDKIVIDDGLFFSALQYGGIQHSFIHFRKQCQIVDIHSSIPSNGEMMTREFSRSTSFTTSSIYGTIYSRP